MNDRWTELANKGNKEIEKAIKFLVEKVSSDSINPKSVIVHCFRVAFILDFYREKKKIVIAALLHDLLEDTDATLTEIKKNFGEEVGDLVLSMTFDQTTNDKKKRYEENYIKAAKIGKAALVIRAADLFDNSNYYHLAKDYNSRLKLINKFNYFLEIANKKIGNEKIYQDLVEKAKSLNI